MNLSDIISKIIGISKDEITEETSPVTVEDWTSMKQLMLISAVQEACNVKFTFKEMKQLRSAGAFLEILTKKGIQVKL